MPTELSTSTQKTISIAISVLKLQDPKLIQTLKDLLTFIPNPNHANRVLEMAIVELIDQCPQAALWLFHHAELLEPEIKVKDIIMNELTKKLLAWGYTSGDFRVTDNQEFEMDAAVKQSLLAHSREGADNAALSLICALLPSIP